MYSSKSGDLGGHFSLVLLLEKKKRTKIVT